MARKSKPINIEEIPGEQFPSLAAAQQAAMSDLSLHLAQTVRDLLASGRLVNVNGKITVNTNR
jgi:hypothetical protein